MILKRNILTSASIIFCFAVAALPSLAFAGVYSYIPCTTTGDTGKNCGENDDFFLNLGTPVRCDEIGGGLVTPPLGGSNIRIIGGQVCAVGSGSDVPGYYDPDPNNIGAYSDITTMPGYNGNGRPPSWTYTKTPFQAPFTSSIPGTEFTGWAQGGTPYMIARFFPGAQNISIPYSGTVVGDKIEISVGSNTYGATGNQCKVTDINNFDPGTSYGPTVFPANPGDALSFKVFNTCRPNDGVGTWGSGQAYLDFNPVTYCYTAAYIQYLNQGGAGYQNVVDYHPTAAGTCAPTSAIPALSAKWVTSGTNTQTMQVSPGIQTIYFNYWNSGQTGSQASDIVCNESTTGQSVSPNNPPNCPNVTLTAN